MAEPTLSIVMPNYNHGHCIAEALEAILAQSFRPLEVIVIDDGSTDRSVTVIEDFVHRDPLVRLLRNERNMGVIYTVNRGLQEARGDYISPLSADDKVLPGLFEKSMNLLARYPQAGLCTSLGRFVDEQGQEIPRDHLGLAISKSECFLPPRQALKILMRDGIWFETNTIYRRDALLEAGGAIPELRSFYDNFISRVLAVKHGACLVPEVLGIVTVGKANFGSEQLSLERHFELMRQAKELMRTRFGGIFPEGYVKEFWKQSLYVGGVLAYREFQVHQRECAARLEHFLEGPTVGDRLFLGGLRLLTAVQTMIVRLYLFLRFRHLSRWAFKRALGLARVKPGLGKSSKGPSESEAGT